MQNENTNSNDTVNNSEDEFIRIYGKKLKDFSEDDLISSGLSSMLTTSDNRYNKYFKETDVFNNYVQIYIPSELSVSTPENKKFIPSAVREDLITWIKKYLFANGYTSTSGKGGWLLKNKSLQEEEVTLIKSFKNEILEEDILDLCELCRVIGICTFQEAISLEINNTIRFISSDKDKLNLDCFVRFILPFSVRDEQGNKTFIFNKISSEIKKHHRDLFPEENPKSKIRAFPETGLDELTQKSFPKLHPETYYGIFEEYDQEALKRVLRLEIDRT